MGERGKPPSFKGKTHSEATKKRIGESVSAKLTGKPRKEFSEEHINHLSQSISDSWERRREQRTANNQPHNEPPSQP